MLGFSSVFQGTAERPLRKELLHTTAKGLTLDTL